MARFNLDELLTAKGLAREALEHRAVSKEHRHHLAQVIGADWETLAPFIGVPPEDVEDIKQEYTRPVVMRLALMTKWHQLYGRDQATYLKLINGLVQVGRRDLIDYLFDELASETMIGCRKCSFLLSPYFVVVMIIVGLVLRKTLTGIQLPAHDRMKQYYKVEFWDRYNYFKAAAADRNPKSSSTTSNYARPEFDLPAIHHDYFVGREKDISMIVSMMSSARIININGAQGIGKSTLAIRVGYTVMIKSGTSVRYIEMDEKFSLFKNLNRYSGAMVRDSMKSKVLRHNKSFIQELQKWSGNIRRPTVLILDNCDDILVSSSHDDFLRLIKSLIDHSKSNLHVIIVSTEKLNLRISKGFKQWTVTNLTLSNSIYFLNQFMTPGLSIDASNLTAVAELVEGNPLGLKIVGKFVNLHGEQIIHKVKQRLNNNPLNTSNPRSFQKEKIHTVLDVAYTRLGALKCGYILGLIFPGSFDKNAGVAVSSVKCFELYRQYSLLDEYYLGSEYIQYRRYKMHRLIREYVKEKLSDTNEVINTEFKEFYQEFVLKFAKKRSPLNEFEMYSLSLETHNLDLLKGLLVQTKGLLVKQLAILAFLVTEGFFQSEELHEYSTLYMDKISDICQHINEYVCGKFYVYVVNDSLQNCKCETLTKYALNFFSSPCMNVFKCAVVEQILNLCTKTMLCVVLYSQDKLVSHFLHHVESMCDNSFGLIDSYILRIVMAIMTIVFGICGTFSFIVVCKACCNQKPSCSCISFMLAPVVCLSFVLCHQLITSINQLDHVNSLDVRTNFCNCINTMLILSILLACGLKIYYVKFKKGSKLKNINIIMTFHIIICMTVFLFIDKINTSMCMFLPICRL